MEAYIMDELNGTRIEYVDKVLFRTSNPVSFGAVHRPSGKGRDDNGGYNDRRNAESS